MACEAGSLPWARDSVRCLRPLHQGRGHCHGAALHEPAVIVCDELGTESGDAGDGPSPRVTSAFVILLRTVLLTYSAGLRKKPRR